MGFLALRFLGFWIDATSEKEHAGVTASAVRSGIRVFSKHCVGVRVDSSRVARDAKNSMSCVV